MNYLIKIFFTLITALLLAFLVFYFWASSSFYPESDYYRIKHFHNAAYPEKDTFSVMTFNIGYLSGLNNNLPEKTSGDTVRAHLLKAVTVISELNPDFIGFQEIDYYSKRSAYLNQFDSIGERAGYYSGAMAVNWDKKYVPFPYWPPGVHFGKILSGQAVLSHYDIFRNDITVLPKPESNPFYYNAFYLDRLIQSSYTRLSDGRPFLIINVHLEAFDPVARMHDSEILVQYLKNIPDGIPFLLIGDFNARLPYSSGVTSREKTIHIILDSGLQSAIDKNIYLADPGKYYTFNSREPFEKIDYIFYNPARIGKIDAFVVREMGEISDHLPVYMKFIFKN